ncbi:MAG: PQQ-dependent sugar dehydrogenase, partial [Candidatus Kariarchaeaceae archaeon]
MTSLVFAGFYFGYIGGGSKFAQGVVYSSDEFEFPINYIEPNDGTNRAFILEQKGKVIVFEKGNVGDKKVALDLKAVRDFHFDWEGGLLGIEFSPNFVVDNYVYLFYTANDTTRHPSTDSCTTCINSILSRFTIDTDNPNKLNESSELILLQIPQFREWHRAGQLNFGPDGMLYVNVGEGLQGGDDLNDFYGKILRIDVTTTSPGLNYSIPVDNPFVGNLNGFKEEIYAYGLRNPWRSSFDFLTGTLWVADVGLDSWEEINIVREGQDYGWPFMEGTYCTDDWLGCSTENYTAPNYVYPHKKNTSSSFFERIFGNQDELDKPSGRAIIGGHVYRGSNFPELIGKYVFADYSGVVWALDYDFINDEVETVEYITRFPDTISSVGKTSSGELYFTGHLLGYIYKLEYLTNFIVTVVVFLLIAISASMIFATLWVNFRVKGKTEPFDFRKLMKPILNRSMIIFMIIILLIGL